MRTKAAFNRGNLSAACKCGAFFAMLLLPTMLFAQTRGKVEVVKDAKVDSLIEGYVTGGKSGAPVVPESSEGYRVQIFSGSNRKGAYSAQAKFQDKYPDQRTYISYREPNFKVRVGDFRSRLEAEKMVEELRNSFTGLFIITEKINLPKSDNE